MRKLKRTTLPDDVKNALAEAKNRGLSWDDFDKHQERGCLRKMQSGMCAYCERKLDLSDARTRIDHFVPQSSSAGKSRVFDWTNHYLSCDCLETCDSHKSDDIRTIVNPDTDNPSAFFTYTATGTICVAEGVSSNDIHKAQDTIDVLNLDCQSLKASRVIAFNKMLKRLGENAMRQVIQYRVVEFHTFCEFMLNRKHA